MKTDLMISLKESCWSCTKVENVSFFIGLNNAIGNLIFVREELGFVTHDV
jgi:hypothetical protein